MQVRLALYPGFIVNFLTCLSSAVTTGLGVGAYELFKGRPIGVLASASALNSGFVAATFFSMFALWVVFMALHGADLGITCRYP